MDQCKHCSVRGDLTKCFDTKCSYHALWMVREIKRLYTNEIVLANSMLEWIEDILDDKEVSEFAMSFPIVRQVWELKQNEKEKMND